MGKAQRGKLKAALGYAALLVVAAVLAAGCQPRAEITAKDTSNLPDESSTTEALASSPVTDAQPESATSDPTAETETLTEADQTGQLAKLSPEQVKQLLEPESTSPNLKVERQAVIVPGYVPEGFEVSNLVVSESGEYDVYTYYDITYSSPTGACFVVKQYAFDGNTGLTGN
jgi:cytoskeletal protein RodZ